DSVDAPEVNVHRRVRQSLKREQIKDALYGRREKVQRQQQAGHELEQHELGPQKALQLFGIRGTESGQEIDGEEDVEGQGKTVREEQAVHRAGGRTDLEEKQRHDQHRQRHEERSENDFAGRTAVELEKQRRRAQQIGDDLALIDARGENVVG